MNKTPNIVTRRLQGVSVEVSYRGHRVFFNHLANQTFITKDGFKIMAYDGKKVDEAKATIDQLLD